MTPYLALAAGVLAFSTSGVLAKLCGAPAIAIAFWVRIVSLSYLLSTLGFSKGRGAGGSLVDARRHGIAGGLIFGFHILTYFWALKLTSVTVVFLLSAMQPAVVGVFGAILLGERLTLKQALWTAVAIGAAGFIVVGHDASGATDLFGNSIAVLSSLGYCAYFLVSRDARRILGTVEYLTVVTATSLVVVGAVASIGGVSLALRDPHDIWLLALMGFLPGTVGHVTVSWALRHVEAHAASTIMLATPLLASLWAYCFVGEIVSVGQIVAGLVVLSAIPGAIRRPELQVTAGVSDPAADGRNHSGRYSPV